MIHLPPCTVIQAHLSESTPTPHVFPLESLSLEAHQGRYISVSCFMVLNVVTSDSPSSLVEKILRRSKYDVYCVFGVDQHILSLKHAGFLGRWYSTLSWWRNRQTARVSVFLTSIVTFSRVVVHVKFFNINVLRIAFCYTNRPAVDLSLIHISTGWNKKSGY